MINTMRRTVLILVFITIFLIPSFVHADVMLPEYMNAKCNLGEKMVTCSYYTNEPFGAKTQDGCKNYDSNPNYRYLTSSGHSFGGTVKYCYMGDKIPWWHALVFNNLLSALFLTLILELPIYYLYGYRKTKKLVIISIVNIISVGLFWLYELGIGAGIIKVLFGEVVIILGEAGLLTYSLKGRFPRLLTISFIANTVSALLGYGILYLLAYLVS